MTAKLGLCVNLMKAEMECVRTGGLDYRKSLDIMRGLNTQAVMEFVQNNRTSCRYHVLTSRLRILFKEADQDL
jgi:hypothetical protein